MNERYEAGMKGRGLCLGTLFLAGVMGAGLGGNRASAAVTTWQNTGGAWGTAAKLALSAPAPPAP